MNKYEREQRHRTYSTLQSLGFTYAECEALRRISMTLQRWHELECGTEQGHIERDGPEDFDTPYFYPSYTGSGKQPRYKTPDREKGARKRLAGILLNQLNRTKDSDGTIKGPALSAYVQGDPRGSALYILRPGDIPEGEDVNAYYSRGIAVY